MAHQSSEQSISHTLDARYSVTAYNFHIVNETVSVGFQTFDAQKPIDRQEVVVQLVTWMKLTSFMVERSRKLLKSPIAAAGLPAGYRVDALELQEECLASMLGGILTDNVVFAQNLVGVLLDSIKNTHKMVSIMEEPGGLSTPLAPVLEGQIAFLTFLLDEWALREVAGKVTHEEQLFITRSLGIGCVELDTHRPDTSFL